MTDPIFLSVQDVLDIHRNTLRYEGGASGVRDLGLLESAVAVPRQSFAGRYLHPDLGAMAAAYLYHLAMNHPFVDGNKRVALAACLVFLVANDAAALPHADDALQVVLSVAAGEMTKDELTVWLGASVN